MTPEPVFVYYKYKNCPACIQISRRWDEIVKVLKQVYPALRFFTLESKEKTGVFDPSTAPKDLLTYAKWYPMFLLVPGRTWDLAMSQLGPNNNVEIKGGVQIMNGKWAGDSFGWSGRLATSLPRSVTSYERPWPSVFSCTQPRSTRSLWALVRNSGDG